jgi:trehalose 6-phosphate phosphatase
MMRAPDLRPAHAWCLFLDVDGTLIELTDTPLDTRAGDDLKSLLQRVERRLDGALALVSGRGIDYLDALFAPLQVPTAGLHGVERRSASGAMHGAKVDASRLDAARAALALLVTAHPGTLLEDKGRTVAVHYRLAPQAEEAVRRSVAEVAARLGPAYHVQPGNMMLEIKPRGYSKGDAIDGFMKEPPFAGRKPVFVGDDLTDIDGFTRVVSHGGCSIGVGDRVAGQFHLADPSAVREWLARIAAPGP